MPVRFFKNPLFTFFLVLIGIHQSLSAQPFRSFETHVKLIYTGEPFFLAYWVDENSISLFDANQAKIEVTPEYNSKTGEVIFQRPDGANVPIPDAIIRYKAMPLLFAPVNRPKGYVFTDQQSPENKLQTEKPKLVPVDLFGDPSIRRNGSLTRGIIAGTNRDFTIESGLRFELSGNLTDSVTLFATLTDQSTPIQPDGSTQNIREFDQVLIRVASPDFQIQMGDVDISLQNSEFARIRRRLQGVQARSGYGNRSVEAGLAVPRGRFRTQQFNGIDGLQGPYRLAGDRGENFIVILAGSEKVYLDGLPLVRGEENDYIIDYGLGEIRFTPKRVITDFSRITIDFQYQDTEYNRTLMAGESNIRWGKNGNWFSGASVIREADNQDLQALSFSDEDIQALQNAGNDRLILVSGVRLATQTERESGIVYERATKDTAGTQVSYYQATTSREIPVYSIRFGKTEIGSGAYRRIGESLNGITYEFVGAGNGDYDTLRVIRPPSSNQMAVIRTGFNDGQNRFQMELAGNQFQGNRLSKTSDPASAYAYLLDGQLKSKKSTFGQFGVAARQRNASEKMEFFDRTLDIEFSRKWDINPADLAVQAEERISEVETTWDLNKSTNARLRRGWYEKGFLSANRNEFFVQSGTGENLKSWMRRESIESRQQNSAEEGEWTRYQADVSGSLKSGKWLFAPKIYAEQENRKRSNGGVETSESFEFLDVRPGIKMSMAEAITASFDFSFRDDQRFAEGALRKESVSRTIQAQVIAAPVNWYSVDASAAHRKRNFTPYFEQNLNREDSDGLLLRASQILKPFASGVFIQTLYEVNTERKAQLQETYVEIGPELGQFVWVDLNEDQVQQIAEFFPEQTPNEGTFVKQWIPGDILLPVVALNARARFRFEPWRIKSLSGSPLQKIAFESTLDVRENSTTRNLSDMYLMRWDTFQDSSKTLQGRFSWRNQVSLFPNHAKGEIKILSDFSRGMNNQTSGIERQRTNNMKLDGRYRISTNISFQATAGSESNRVISTSFETRNFEIRTKRFEPGLNWSPDPKFFYTLTAGLAEKTEAISGATGTMSSIKNTVNIQQRDGLQLNANISFRKAAISGTPSPSAVFELTEGAGIGNSWLWSAQTNYRINALLRMSFSYDGRTVPANKAVHTVRFLISAIF